jgi:hypothetical protein
MSSKHHYCHTADEEMDYPSLFLPTSLRFNGTNSYWTQQAYALFSQTQTPKDLLPNWRELESNNPQLPPKINLLNQKQGSLPKYITKYTDEFKEALRMVQAWYKSQPTNKTMEGQIESWIQTCDTLTENKHFNEQQNWGIPTFQPWYHFDTHLCLQQYFYIRNRIEPNRQAELGKQKTSAEKMFNTWEEVCFRVFQRNFTPIPKCLWYYKLKYLQRDESAKWKSFFHDTPFQSWGHAEEVHERDRNRRRNPIKKNPNPQNSPNTPTNKLAKDKPLNPTLTLTPPRSPKKPQANPPKENRTSKGTGDYPPPASPTARVNDRPTKNKKKFCVYYQNARGLRDEEKLEYLSRFMENKKIDAFILMETHLEGDFQHILPKNQLFIHHGPENQPHQGAKGGVGVILSPELANHWIKGKDKMVKGGLSSGGTTTFMCVNIKLKTKKLNALTII